MSLRKSAGSASSVVVECSAEELEQLMVLRGEDAVEKIRRDYGDMEQLCQRLRTDPVTGQSVSQLTQQSTVEIKKKIIFFLFLWRHTIITSEALGTCV